MNKPIYVTTLQSSQTRHQMKTRAICIGSAVKCTLAYNLLARLTGGLTLELEDGLPPEVIREAANGTASKETREATGDAMSDAEDCV